MQHFALDLQADHEEKQGHRAVVHKVAQVFLNPHEVEVEHEVGAPQVVVALTPGRICPRNRNQGGRHQHDPAGDLRPDECLQRHGQPPRDERYRARTRRELSHPCSLTGREARCGDFPTATPSPCVTIRLARPRSCQVTTLIVVIVVIAIVVILLLWFFGMYNGLVRSRVRVKESWSGIDVQLKRRSSLIPNLVETVKGYAAHEKEVLENVTRARAMLDRAETPHQAAQADNMLQATLRSLFAVAENYPDLKANQNFLELQRELTDTEDKIAYARQFYNTNVSSYNQKIQVVPTNMIAGMFNFTAEEFYEAEEAAREDVKVSFG